MLCDYCSREIPSDALYCCYCGRLTAAGRLGHSGKGKSHRGNGTGSVYKRPDGKYQVTVTLGWYIQDGVKKRRTVTRTFVKKADAVNAAATLKGQKPSSRETLRELWEQYTSSRPYQALSASQRDKLGYAWKRLRPLELRPIAELTIDDLQQTVDAATDTYYPARDMKVVLSHLYELAVKREIVQSNKADYIDLPDAPKARRETWTDEDIDAMWRDYNAGNFFTGYILIMCYCGLRYGELATVRIENINLEERYMIGGIKTEAGTDRVIPIAAAVLPILRVLCQAGRDTLISMGHNQFYDAYWQTIERIGLRKLPPQTGRHYYFTSLTAAGVQAGIITETGGHASYLTTMKNYVRIPLGDKLAAVDRIHTAPPQDSH